jgi:hypothetical protein
MDGSVDEWLDDGCMDGWIRWVGMGISLEGSWMVQWMDGWMMDANGWMDTMGCHGRLS